MFKNKKNLHRLFFFSLVLLTTFVLSILFYHLFLKEHFYASLLILFILLTFELSMSFWTAIIGFIILVSKKNKFSTTSGQVKEKFIKSFKKPKTALVLLTYNESPEDIFNKLNAIYQSLIQLKCLHLFDVFILSDSDCQQIQLTEKRYWQKMCEAYQAHDKIFYNNRSMNTDAKSGHIDEFTSKWGDQYSFMVILDSDSLMSANALVEIFYRIHTNPKVAILQTATQTFNQKSLFARIFQFSDSLYGRIYSSGSAFWQLSESNYYGHNAIIRIDAFKKFAKLPTLPGKRPFGGKILSHDFVEAALLREAGWEIWMADDIVDSYEELPNNLIHYAKRDRRWCQGNLQHSWFMFSKNMSTYSRFLFFKGIMAYLASPLWLCFFILSCVFLFTNGALDTSVENAFILSKQSLFFIILGLLFIPKLLGLILHLLDAASIKNYGGRFKTIIGFVLECGFSIIVTPILMLYRNQFIFEILLQRNIGWPAQERRRSELSFKSAFLAHGHQMIIGLILFLYVSICAPNYIWWLLPFYFGLMISVPLSVLLSGSSIGEKTLHWGLFCIPEELNPPEIIRLLYAEENKYNHLDLEEGNELDAF